jgi:hypothetical protein
MNIPNAKRAAPCGTALCHDQHRISGADQVRLFGSLGSSFGGRSSSVSSFGRGCSSAFGGSGGRISSSVGGFGSSVNRGISIGFGVSGHGINSFFGFGGGFAAASSKAESRGRDGGSEDDLAHNDNSFFSE